MKEQPKWGPGEVTYGGLTRSMHREARLRQQLLALVGAWYDMAMQTNSMKRAATFQQCADMLRRVLGAE